MYETETFETILRRMLARIASKFDKREGSMIYDPLAASSAEFQNLYIALDTVLNEVFADTASREYLIKHCAERGISPKSASYAVVQGVFTPDTVGIPIGSRFSHDDYNYTVIERVDYGVYKLQCETIGSEPNGVTGQLIPIDYINGLQTAEITEVLILGEDEEDTETLRARWRASINSEAFGGNKIDYENKILSIPGVGGVKIYSGSEWNGGGTVKCVIIDSDHGVPTEELVDAVQTEIDPETNQGEGVGVAPIGHFVTIMGANNTVVNITTSLVFETGFTWDSVKTAVETAVDEYLNKLNASWAARDKNFNYYGTIVRINQIENQIFTIPGVIDVFDTKINGKAENLTIDKDSIVTRGTINE